ncbi:MAG: ribulose-phosphate 3-epimerase, partial [Nanoarchaeota archaeon]
EKQLFLKSVLEKVKEVRKKYPKLNIQLDGGINDKNAKEIFDAGANILSVGSFISSSENPKKALDSLKKIAEKN